MKKFIFAGLICLFFLSCETGLNLNLNCVLKHTTQVVKLESGLLGNKTQVLVNLSWTWIEQPSGDGVIVERSTDSTNWVMVDSLAPIAAAMTVNDTDSLLIPGDTVWYRLGYYSGADIQYFITPKLILPQSQHFYQPAADTIGNDTLNIAFAKLSGFDQYILSLFKANVTQPESLMNLKNPLWCDTLADTTLVLPIPDSLFADTAIYTIKIDASKVVQLLTDGSFGFRAFFKKP
jgi:hypothetical protein